MKSTPERIAATSARSPLRAEVAQAFSADGELAQADRRFQSREVQTDLADAVASATGAAGFAARAGGDEFVVALPGADLATATAVAERVRRNLDGATPPESANGAAAISGVSATISIGLAADDAYCELASLLAASDEALYRAKEAGGDATAQRESAGIRQQPVAPRPPGA